jgi:tetratricopeptide (TPR) repeat protein
MHPNKISRPILFCLSIFIFLMPTLQNVDGADLQEEAFQRAEALLQEKKTTEALALYEDILARDPSFVSAYPGLVKCYIALGDIEGGSAFIESLYLEAPDNAGINYGMGFALFKQKNYQTAAEYFERAIKLDPDLAEAWNNMAVIYHFVERDYEKARQYYEKAIVLGQRAHNQRVADIAQKNLAHLPKEEVITPVTETLTLEDFLNRFIALVEKGDKAKLQGLVLGQKDNSIKAMDWLVEQAEKAHSQGDNKSEKNAVALAQILADQYSKSYESDVLSTKLEKYQRTEPQKTEP